VLREKLQTAKKILAGSGSKKEKRTYLMMVGP